MKGSVKVEANLIVDAVEFLASNELILNKAFQHHVQILILFYWFTELDLLLSTHLLPTSCQPAETHLSLAYKMVRKFILNRHLYDQTAQSIEVLAAQFWYEDLLQMIYDYLKGIFPLLAHSLYFVKTFTL